MTRIPRKTYIAVLLAAMAILALLLVCVHTLSGGIGENVTEDTVFPLRISECMSSNTAYANPDGLFCDWIEIENTADHEFNLSGYRLSDNLTETKYAFPTGTVIPAGGYIVVWCSGERNGGLYAPFSLNRRGGETLQLMNSANTVLDEVETLHLTRNYSLIRKPDGSFDISTTPTPGYPNTKEGYDAYLLESGQGTGAIRLNEIMTSAEHVPSPLGIPMDWIEIVNLSSQNMDISGMHLSDKEGEVRYTFPEGTYLPAEGYYIVWCSGDDRGGEYAPFRLNRRGETVILSDRDAVAVDRVQVPILGDDTVYSRTEGGWIVSDRPTPGYANTEDGYAAWVSASGYGDVSIRISELCLKNLSLLRDGFGEYTDWIELCNTGSTAVSLEGWFITDQTEKMRGWTFPDISLEPGECLLVFASGRNQQEGELHTDFALSVGETVTLYTPIGSIADRVGCAATDENCSVVFDDTGEWTECSAPTPGTVNP